MLKQGIFLLISYLSLYFVKCYEKYTNKCQPYIVTINKDLHQLLCSPVIFIIVHIIVQLHPLYFRRHKK